MNEAQIKHMVDRFLNWKLPANFHPDNGVSFEPTANKNTPYEMKREPSGTNLLDATQADAMVRHMLDGMPTSDSLLKDCLAVLAPSCRADEIALTRRIEAHLGVKAEPAGSY